MNMAKWWQLGRLRGINQFVCKLLYSSNSAHAQQQLACVQLFFSIQMDGGWAVKTGGKNNPKKTDDTITSYFLGP